MRESSNLANHASLALPDNDHAPPNFGRVPPAGAPRLLQFGVKLVF